MTSQLAAVQAILVYLLVLLLSALLAPAPSSKFVWLLSSLLQLFLVLGLPMGAGWALRLNLRETFQLHPPRCRQLLISAGMALLAIPLLGQVSYLQSRWFPDPGNLSQQLSQLLRVDSIGEGLLVLLAMAVLPAVCEEFFFRGFLFSRLSAHENLWRGLLVSSVLFGFFHPSVAAVPATLSGLLFAFICHRTKSIFNCMMAHGLINGWAILIVNSNLPHYLYWTQDGQPVPWPLLAVALAGMFLLGKRLGAGTNPEN